MKLAELKPIDVRSIPNKADLPETPEQVAKKVERAAIATATESARKAKELWKIHIFRSWRELADKTGIAIPPQFNDSTPISWENVEIACQHTQLYAKAKVAMSTVAAATIKPSSAAEYRKLGSEAVSPYHTVGAYTLKPRQVRAFEMFKRAYDAFLADPEHAPSGIMIPIEAGEGKTIITAACIKYVQTINPPPKGEMTMYRIMWLAPASVLPSTRWKLDRCKVTGGTDLWLMTHNSLSTKAMERMFMKETESSYFNDVERYVYIGPTPVLLVVDERHAFKKAESEKTKRYDAIVSAGRGNTFVLELSATPAVTVNDMRSFVLAANYRLNNELVTSLNWKSCASIMAGTTNLDVPNASAMDRFRKALGDLIVYPPKDKRKFRSKNKILLVPFPNEEWKQHYMEAQLRFLEAKERAHQMVSERGMVTAKFTILRMCESQIKCKVLPQLAMRRHAEGYAVVTFHPFMDDIRDMVRAYLELGIPRSKISVIWGGAKPIPKHLIITDANEIGRMFGLMSEWQPKYLAAKEIGDTPPECPLSKFELRQYKATLKNWMELKQRNMTDAEQAERNDFMRRHKLFNQTAPERFVENMNFQEGRTEFCVVSMAAGGAGIDLDHQIEGVRPRWVYTNIAYYGEEMMQVFGRCMRAGTLSNVTQEMVFFEDTIAAKHVAPILDKKLGSILTFAQGSIIDFAALIENKASLSDLTNATMLKFRNDTDIEHEEPEEISEIENSELDDDDDDTITL